MPKKTLTQRVKDLELTLKQWGPLVDQRFDDMDNHGNMLKIRIDGLESSRDSCADLRDLRAALNRMRLNPLGKRFKLMQASDVNIGGKYIEASLYEWNDSYWDKLHSWSNISMWRAKRKFVSFYGKKELNNCWILK